MFCSFRFGQYASDLAKAMRVKPKLEIWRSSENQEEHHYFMVGQAQGHEPNAYLFGINPRFFGPEKVERILKMLREGEP